MIDTVVITRHPALVALLVERGLIEAGVSVLADATPQDVVGRHVIGVLPLWLAALAASTTEIPLTGLLPEERGKEIGLDRLREIAGPAVRYTVAVVALRRV